MTNKVIKLEALLQCYKHRQPKTIPWWF